MTKIKVFLTDDHSLITEAISTLIRPHEDFEVVGTARTGADAVVAVAKLKPDIVVMDLLLPGIDGIEATKQIKQQCPATKVIMLSAIADDDRVREASTAGSSAYLDKSSSADNLLSTLRRVNAGERMPAFVKDRHIVSFAKDETKTLHLLALGHSMREIAALRAVPLNVIQEQVLALRKRLRTESTQALLQFAFETNLLPKSTLALAGSAPPDTIRANRKSGSYNRSKKQRQ